MYNPEEPIFANAQPPVKTVSIGIYEKPKHWYETVMYAFQITLVDFTPFIWASVFLSLAGLGDSMLPALIKNSFLAMGVGTLLQTFIGNRLPIVQGPSASVLTAMGGVAATYGMPAMWGGVLVGGLLEAAVGLSRIVGFLRKFIPPVVTGSVVAVIGFSACRIAIGWIFSSQDPMMLTLAFIAFILAMVLKFMGKGIVEKGFILISVIIVGVIVSSILGYYNWGAVAEAKWLAAPSFLPITGIAGEEGPHITFVFAAFLGVLVGYIGSIFESLGDYAATCAVSGEVFRVKHINRGIFSEGLGCVASSLLGGLPTTSYSQNVGIVAATGVASLHVTRVAAVFFLLFGLSPKFATFLAAIPRPIVGAVFLITASLIMFSGLDVVLSETRNTRNTLIAGTAIGLGVSVPYWAAAGGAEWVATFGSFMKMFISNNIFIAVVVGVVMNIFLNLVMKDRSTGPKDTTEAEAPPPPEPVQTE